MGVIAGFASLGRRSIAYCRTPGLLARAAGEARAARQGRSERPHPLVLADGRLVRDADAFALARGVQASQAVAQARQLCPNLTVIALEAVDSRTHTARFLDLLADLSPAVEPDGPDAAYLDVTGAAFDPAALSTDVLALTGFSPALGLGASRLAARACAECDLPPGRLAEASVDWLWSEDVEVVARLKRLGLETFGAVAGVGEDALFYQFGRIGRLMHRRAHGQDFAAVKALYPPPRADDRLDLSEHPLEDQTMLQAALATLAHEVSEQLTALGRYGRRVVLRVGTEQGEVRGEWVTPAAVQDAQAVTQAAQRLLMTLAIPAPVTFLRLLVEDLETARAVTPDLFAGRTVRDTRALEAARCVLCDRYGPQALTPLGLRQQTTREKRRAAERELWR